MRFQIQVSKVFQVLCQQEGFNQNHIWTMWWNKEEQNYSWSNLRSGRQAGRLIEFLNRLHTVCYGGDDSCLSCTPYKQDVVVNLLNNFSNRKPHNTHEFKEEVKIKYDSVKAIARKFPNGTTETIPLDLVAYCVLTPDKQLTWEERGNKLNKAMFYLMDSKNK